MKINKAKGAAWLAGAGVFVAAGISWAMTTPLTPIGWQLEDLDHLFTGRVAIGKPLEDQRSSLQIVKASGDASNNFGSGYLVLGKEKGTSLAMDNNEILTRSHNNGKMKSSNMHLNAEGGKVSFGRSLYVHENGNVSLGTTTEDGGWSGEWLDNVKDYLEGGSQYSRNRRMLNINGNLVSGSLLSHTGHFANVFISDKYGDSVKRPYHFTDLGGEKHPIPADAVNAVRFHATGLTAAKEFVIDHRNWPDYVFSNEYELMPLAEVEANIEQNGHLPGVPDEEQATQGKTDLGSLQRKLLEKVEELTIHASRQDEELARQQREIELLAQQLENVSE